MVLMLSFILSCHHAEKTEQQTLVFRMSSPVQGQNTEFSEASLGFFLFFINISYPELTSEDRNDPEIMSYIFDRFIEDLNLAACAMESGITVSEKNIDQFIQNELTHMTFKLQTPEDQAFYRKEIKKRLLIRNFLKTEIIEKIKLSDDDAKTYYNQHIDHYMIEPKFCIRQIQFESKEKGLEFRKAFNTGQTTFMDLAKTFEENASAYELAPCLPLSSFPETFRKTIRRLKPGSISKVLALDYGSKTLYHVLMLERKTPSVEYKFEEMLPKIKSILEKEATDQRLKQKKIKFSTQRTKVIFKENLPFKYIEPEQRRSEQ
jgi:parvulin-like peptidyl-prolyl isomerase